MTQVNNHSRALIEVDDIDISKFPVDTQRRPMLPVRFELLNHAIVIEQAIADIRKYQDRMSIDGRAIQHIADSLEKLI